MRVEFTNSIGYERRRGLVAPTDVSDAGSVRRLFEMTRATFGRLDLLFNNAGTSTPGVPLEELFAYAVELVQSALVVDFAYVVQLRTDRYDLYVPAEILPVFPMDTDQGDADSALQAAAMRLERLSSSPAHISRKASGSSS